MASAMTTLTANLSQFAPLRLGATHIVVFPATTGLSFLALGTPLTTPIPVLGAPYVFVDPTQLLALPLLSVGAASYSFPVPAAQSLIGYQLAEQRFDLTSLGTLVGSNPILGTVTP